MITNLAELDQQTNRTKKHESPYSNVQNIEDPTFFT
jgi:hypothetical protein